MKNIYCTNRHMIILIGLLLSTIVAGVIVGYIAFFGFKNSIIIMISLFVIVVIPALFMNRNGLAISDYWNFKIQLDDACICSIARKGGKKMYRWEQIEAVECRYSIIYSRISLLIWYKKRECIEIPDCMKESKELCLKIYKNIKEKNSAAQLDNRFITYIQKHCYSR